MRGILLRAAGLVAVYLLVLTSAMPGDVLIVHLIDASDPAAVRARHARTHERWQRRVVP